MFIEAISEIATQIVASGTIKAEGVGDVCASAPTGVEPYVNDILGWVNDPEIVGAIEAALTR